MWLTLKLRVQGRVFGSRLTLGWVGHNWKSIMICSKWAQSSRGFAGGSDCGSLQWAETEGLARGEVRSQGLVRLQDQVTPCHPFIDLDLDPDPGLFSCSKEIDLDIGKQEESLANYRATLSHKCCHSFKPNSHFAQFWHPMWVQAHFTWYILTFGCAGMVWSCPLLHPGTWWRGRRFLSPTTTPSRRLRNGIRSVAGWILLIQMPPQISNHWHCPKYTLHNTYYTIPNNYTL